MDVDNQKDTTTTTAMETEDSEKLKYEYKPGNCTACAMRHSTNSNLLNKPL